ncbi:MAG: hypothetical protein RML84_09155 [Anaerolineae bacterium]|nr:hypothetical protein [Anaerolineae bacterium]
MIGVAEQKEAIVQMIGAVSPEVGAIVAQNIDDIWQAALRHSCTGLLAFLYAQREALDFALAWLAPRVSAKRGFGDAIRVAQGALRSRSESAVEGASQGWSCDWSNTSSYSAHKTDGDGFTRALSESDAESFVFFRSAGYDRSVSRNDAHARSDASRQSNTVRTSESASSSDTVGWGYNAETAGFYLHLPYPTEQWNYQLNLSISVPPTDINLGAITIPAGVFQINVPIASLPPLGPSDARCTVMPAPCPPVLELQDLECRVMSDEDAQQHAYEFAPICNRINMQTSAEVALTVTVPIPMIGSFTIGASWLSSYEQRPRCAASRATTQSSAASVGAQYMRAAAVGSAVSRSESRGFRRNDARQSGEGDSASESQSRSATVSRAVTEAESHSGSDTASHGESQSTSRTDSRSQARSRSWQKTESDRTHEFDIQKLSDAFTALKELRVRVEQQIMQVKGIFKKSEFGAARIVRGGDRRLIHPNRFAYESACSRAPLCGVLRHAV